MHKLIPRILGGLGNQLFIYSAARRLALVNNSELVLDDVSASLIECTGSQGSRDRVCIP